MREVCNCYSYNWCVGETPEVVLKVPQFLKPYIGKERETICVDACIENDILLLWEKEIVTLNSCCGHNRIEASLVLQENANEYISNSIRQIFGDKYKLFSWIDDKLTEV